MTLPVPMQAPNEVLEAVTRHAFAGIIHTLETRSMDNLNFHEVGVSSIRAAINMAYHLGLTQGLQSSNRLYQTVKEVMEAQPNA
jgi:hypothetical protein